MKTKLLVAIGGEGELEVSNAYELHPLVDTGRLLKQVESAVTLANAMAKLREIGAA